MQNGILGHLNLFQCVHGLLAVVAFLQNQKKEKEKEEKGRKMRFLNHFSFFYKRKERKELKRTEANLHPFCWVTDFDWFGCKEEENWLQKT